MVGDAARSEVLRGSTWTKSAPAGASRQELSRQQKPLSLNKGLEVNGSVPVLSRDLTHPREDILSVVMLSPSPRETTTPRRSGYRRSYPIHPIFRVRPSLFGRLSTGWLPIQSCSLVSAEILQACGVRGRRRRRRWRWRRRVHLLPQQQQRRIRHVLRPFPDVRPARRIGQR